MRLIYQKIDPEGLIPKKAWLVIGAIGVQAALLFMTVLWLLFLDKRTPGSTFRYSVILLCCFAGIVLIIQIYGMVLVARRVMEDRMAYRQINEEQQKMIEFTRNLTDALPIGYHSIDYKGIIIEMNQTELDWLGYTKEEVIGKKLVADIYDESFRARSDELFEVFSKQGYLRNIELTLIAKDGGRIPALVTSKALFDDQGNFSRSISTIYNFTERKKLEDELIAARLEAENAQQLKQLFMANMSHEIRTPLNAILGFTNLMSRTRLDATMKEYVQGIQISGSSLLTIVNDILDFEKIRSGMLRVEHIEFDLPGLLHSIVTMIRPSAEEKRLKLHLYTDPDLPALLVGDPMRLTQIIINLLSNAIKFTHLGAVSLRVHALKGAVPDDPVRVRFEVVDTGIGIPEAEHQHIFERFIQAGSDVSRKYGGTGLGLALVKMLVELQQGSIQLTSEPGHGSTFTIEIPYQILSVAPQPAAAMSIEKYDLPDLSGYHILLVEDNPMNRRIAELNLRGAGLKVTPAEDGLQAIECLRANPAAFDLVFMDIQMPGMDGYTTAQMIRTELGLSRLPIVAMTAHVLAGERKKVLASGMNDYLTKPVQQNELITVLLRYLPGFWSAEALHRFSCGNAEHFREIAELFIRQLPLELAELSKALQKNDFKTVCAITHSLRSTAGYGGFEASLGEILTQIEKEAKKENPNPGLFEPLYAALSKDSRQAVAILQREIGVGN